MFFVKLIIFLGILFIGGCNEDINSPNKVYSLQLKESKNKTIILTIQDRYQKVCQINTGASIYQNYKIIWLDEDHILFKSSDIGDSIILKSKDQEWCLFPISEKNYNNKQYFFIFTGKLISPISEDLYDAIQVIIFSPSEKEIIKILNYSGTFSRYKNFTTQIGEKIFISDGKKNQEIK